MKYKPRGHLYKLFIRLRVGRYFILISSYFGLLFLLFPPFFFSSKLRPHFPSYLPVPDHRRINSDGFLFSLCASIAKRWMTSNHTRWQQRQREETDLIWFLQSSVMEACASFLVRPRTALYSGGYFGLEIVVFVGASFSLRRPPSAGKICRLEKHKRRTRLPQLRCLAFRTRKCFRSSKATLSSISGGIRAAQRVDWLLLCRVTKKSNERTARWHDPATGRFLLF